MTSPPETPTQDILTTCPLDCYDICSMVARRDPDGALTVRGNPAHPVTQGRLCARGNRLVHRHLSDERVTEPLKRVDGTLVPVSWEQAIREIADHIHAALTKTGPLSIMHSYDYGSSGVLKLLCDRFFHGLGGWTETVGSICWGAGLAAAEYDFGVAASHAPEDLAEHAQTVVLWGRNVAVTNVHLLSYVRVAKARGAKLVVVNSLPTGLDAEADLVIHVRPGTDGHLALACCHALIQTQRVDTAFIADAVHGYADFCKVASAYALEGVADYCGVEPELIDRLAGLYADGATATVLGIGLQRHRHGGQLIRAINALATITGQMGKPGGGVHFGNRHLLPFIDWDFIQTNRRPAAPTRQFARTTQALDILNAKPGIEVLFVSRTNLVSQLPDSGTTRRALESLPLVVVIDSFLTQTADHADYVLPCALFLEEEDVMFNTMWNPYIGYAHAVCQPVGKAKPDWAIFRDLAKALGLQVDLDIVPRETIREAFGEWMSDGQFKQLLEDGYLRLPVPHVPFLDRHFPTSTGKVELFSERARRESGEPVVKLPEWTSARPGDYPFSLLTVHPKWQENSQGEAALYAQVDPVAEVGPGVLEAIGARDGDMIRIITETGAIVCQARVNRSGRSDVVQLAQGWSRGYENVNVLTSIQTSDLGIGSAQYDTWCRLEKVARATS